MTPSAKTPPLGRRLLSCLERVTDLMETVKSEDELREAPIKSGLSLLRLIGRPGRREPEASQPGVPSGYRGVEAANRKITQAIEDLKMVAEAINKLGQALDLVAKLVPA